MRTLRWPTRPFCPVCFRRNRAGLFKSLTGWLDPMSSTRTRSRSVSLDYHRSVGDAPIALPLARLINEIVIRLAGSKYAVINGNLHVRDAQLEDTRMTYRCYAKHRLYGQQQAFSSPTRIRLEAGDGGLSAPRLVPPTRTLVHAPLGQPVYLACHTYANPPPKIR